MNLRPGSAVLAILVTLGVAGCGEGASSPTTVQRSTRSTPVAAGAPGSHSSVKGSSSERRRFILRADAICRRLGVQIASTTPPELTLAQIARVGPANATLERRAIEDLRKLTPPTSAKGDWSSMLAAAQLLARQLEEMGKHAGANDAKGVKAILASAKAPHEELSVLASRDGLHDCAKFGRYQRSLAHAGSQSST